MKQSELKQLIEDSVRKVFQEEIKNIVLEAVKSNKQSLTESSNSETRTLSFNTNSVPTSTNNKQAYLDILNEMSHGPKSGLEGEFKINGPVNTMAEGSALPNGQLGLDQIMNLMQGK